MDFSFNNSTVAKPNNTTEGEPLNLIGFQIVFLIVTIIATVLGNVLVLAAIYLDSRLRNVTNYFVACLAVSDLLVACFSVTIRLHQYINPGPLNIHVCRFWNWMDIFCEAASIFTLTVISIDRYVKISRPFHYREKMTKTIAIGIIVAIWVFAGLFATLGLFPYGDAAGVIAVPMCWNSNRIFYTFAAFTAFFIPLAILIVMYSLIFRIALYHFKKNNAVTLVNPVTGKQVQYSAHKDLKATRTLFIVVSTFIICWGPFFTMFLVLQYHPTAITGDTRVLLSAIFLILLPSSNSFFNPIIYACFDKVYRRSFRKILLKLAGRQEYLSNTQEYGGHRTRVTRSGFELTPTQRRESLTQSHQLSDREEKHSKNTINGGHEYVTVASPFGTLVTTGSQETDSMLQQET